jgi:predicted ATP-dependent endonuclease of OLD family
MVGHIRLPGQRPLPIDAFGDGARHVFKVLAALTALVAVTDAEHPALFLWEDPELFLHPISLQTLMEQTLKLVVGKPVQLFFSTQSIEVVAYVTRLVSEPELLLSEQLRAFRLGMQDGRLVSSRFLHRNLRSWLEDGMDPRFWGVAATSLEYRLGDSNE